MLSRRDFLRGLIASVASAAFVKNGIAQPEQVVAEPKRAVFDMAANTWREQPELPSMLFGYPVKEWVAGPAFDSPIMTAPLGHLNCRCVIVPDLRDPGVHWVPEFKRWAEDRPVEFYQMKLYVPNHLDDTIVSYAIADVKEARRSSLIFLDLRITAEEVQARIDEYATWEEEILHGIPGSKIPTGVIRLDDENPA